MRMSNRDQSARSTLLGNEPVGRLLAKMAVPATVAMFVNALYNVVDTIFVGRGVGALAIGGLSVAFPLQMIVISIGLMIGIGAASIVSRSLGAGDAERAARTVGTAFTLAALFAIAVSAASYAFIDPLVRLFGATDELFTYARDYLSVILPGAVFVSFAIASNHLVRSEGQALASMTIMLVGAVSNIILDPIFIFGFDMGIRGAALATVVGQFLSFSYAIFFYLSGKSGLALRPHHLVPRPAIVRELLALGVPTFIRQFGASFFVIVTNNALAAYGGNIAISAFGVIHKVLIFSLMPLFGIAQGFQPIAGYNYGAGKLLRVREAVRKAAATSVITASIFFTAVMLFPAAIFSLFSTSTELISLGSYAIRIVLLVIPLIGLQITGTVFFQAVGMAIPSLVLSLSRQILLLIPLVVVLPRFFGLSGVWMAFPVADVLATLITVVWLRYEMRKLHITGCRDAAVDQAGCADQPAGPVLAAQSQPAR